MPRPGLVTGQTTKEVGEAGVREGGAASHSGACGTSPWGHKAFKTVIQV